MQLTDGSYIQDPADRPWLPSMLFEGDAIKILHVDEEHKQVVFLQRFGRNTVQPKHKHHCTAVAFTVDGEWAYDGYAIPKGFIAYEPVNSVHTPMTMNDNNSDVLVILTSKDDRFIEVFADDGSSFHLDMAFFKAAYGMSEQDYIQAQTQGAVASNLHDIPEHDYVSVYDEPMHLPRFRNPFAYAYEVSIPESATTLYHLHAEDTLYVSICDINVLDQSYAQQPVQGQAPRGSTFLRPHKAIPLVHRVTNCCAGGEGVATLIGVEILKSPEQVAKTPLKAPNITFLWEQERARAYKLTLSPNATTGEVTYNFCGPLIILIDAELEITDEQGGVLVETVSSGQVIWQQGPVTKAIKNIGTNTFEAVIGEWL